MNAAGGNLLSSIVAAVSQRASAGAVAENLVADLSRMVSAITGDYLCFNAKQVEKAVDGERSNCSNPAPVIYIPVFECPIVSMGIFYLRYAHSIIPLHDHPGITGLIKVIYGAARVKQVNASQEAGRMSTLFRVDEIRTITASSVSNAAVTVLPNKFNFHEIVPHNVDQNESQGTAFFDVLFPPYDPPARDCSYYELVSPRVPWPSQSPRQLFLRRLPHAPSDEVFNTELGPYFGPHCDFSPLNSSHSV